MATKPTEFAPVELTDDFNTWRTRTNKTLDTLSSNTFTTANTLHSNGTPKAITHGHGQLRGSLSANQLYANTYLSGGEFGNPDTLTITTNNYTYGKLTVANNATIGIDGEDELFSKARLRVTANATFRDIVRMDANVFIGTANTDTLVVNAVSTFDGEATFRDDVVVTANVDITGDSVNITGNTIVGSANTDTLTIHATTDINAATNIDGNVTATGKVTINGNTVVGNANTDTLTVGADTTFNGPVTLNGVTDVSGAVAFNGNTTLGNASTDKLTVPAHSVFQSNVTVGDASTDKLLVTGHAQLSSNLIVEGTTKLNGGTTIGNATGDDLTVTARVASSFVPKTDGVHTLGTTSLRWEEVFADTVTAGNAALSGTLDVTGGTTVDGATTLNGAVTLGNATGDDLTFTGRAASSLVPKTDGAFSLGSNSLRWEQVYADAITAGNTSLSGTLDVDGATTLNGDVTLGNANTDTVTINGASELNGAATVDGVLTVTGASAINGNTTIGNANTDTLTVHALSTFNSNSTFHGEVGFYGNTDFQSSVNIEGALSLGAGFTLSATEGIYERLIVTDHTTLGSSNTDVVRFRAEANSSFIPHIDDTYDLGINNKKWRNIYIDGTAFLDAINLNGTAITSTATEINKLDGFTGVVADLNYAKDLRATGVTTTEFDKLDGLTATTSELNKLDGVTATTAELNYTDGVTSNIQTQLNAKLNLSGGTMSGNTVTEGIRPKTDNTYDLGSAGHEFRNAYVDGTAFIDTLNLNGTNISATAAELNIMDGVTATTSELNKLDGVTSTTTELNKVDGFTGSATDLNYAKDLRATGVTTTEFDKLDGLTATTTELNKLDGVTATTSELNILDGVTSTAAELNKVDGFTGSATDLNYAKDLRATGVTSSEFDFLDGVTSNIQTQLNGKLGTGGTIGSFNATANTQDIGASTKFRDIHAAREFKGTATTAKYADLAEKYLADAEYVEGTVMVVGGEAEVTASSPETAHSVIGVVSAKPAFKMNSGLENGTYVALKGRVPVNISGTVNKGDRLVASNEGKAIKAAEGCGEISFAIALEDGTDGTIEAVIL